MADADIKQAFNDASHGSSHAHASGNAVSGAPTVPDLTNLAPDRSFPVNPGAAKEITGRFGDPRGTSIIASTGKPVPEHDHAGIDVMMDVGTDIHAPANGTITEKRCGAGGYGCVVKMVDDAGYEYVFAHLSAFGDIGVGTTVERDDVLAQSGGAAGARGSGNSRAPHLHYEIHDPDGNPVDPLIIHQDGTSDDAQSGAFDRHHNRRDRFREPPVEDTDPWTGDPLPPAHNPFAETIN